MRIPGFSSKSRPPKAEPHTHDDPGPEAPAGGGRSVLDAESRKQLTQLFRAFTQKVEIHLFAVDDPKEPFAAACRQVLGALGELDPKMRVVHHQMDDPQAREWDVSSSPTMVFCPERVQLKWLGAPVGEETRTLVEIILMLGLERTQFSQQTRKMLQGLNEPRAVKVFISLTCPYCPGQALHAVQAAMLRPDQVSVELIDVQAQPRLADQYHAHGTPQTFANEVLVGPGAQAEELFAASLVALEPVNVFIPDDDAPQVECDLVIVGGGPSGLTAGIYAARGGLQAVVVEKGVLGGQVATTPVVENYPGLTQVGGKTLVDIMVQHALQYCRIYPGEEVQTIEPGQRFTVTTNRRRFLARAVLLCTGARHRHLGCPGEERLSGKGVSYCATCDAPLFKGQRVVVVGGGDSAVTEALHLHNLGAQVTMVHRSGALRAQAYLADQLKERGIPVHYQSRLAEIKGKDRVRQVVLEHLPDGQRVEMEMDGVFIAVGYEPALDLPRHLGLALGPEGYVKVDERHRTSMPGIYAAGDLQGGFKQIVTAAGQGSEAALAIFEDLLNPYYRRERPPA